MYILLSITLCCYSLTNPTKETIMKVALLFLLVAATLFSPLVLASRQQNDKVLLRDVEVLTFRLGEWTTYRRTSAERQVQYTGPKYNNFQMPNTIQCKNQGMSDNDINWKCETSLQKEFTLGTTTVSCEGYAYPDDPYILRGSCFVEFTVTPTSHYSEPKPKPTSPYRPPVNDFLGPRAPVPVPEESHPTFWFFANIILCLTIGYVCVDWFLGPKPKKVYVAPLHNSCSGPGPTCSGSGSSSRQTVTTTTTSPTVIESTRTTTVPASSSDSTRTTTVNNQVHHHHTTTHVHRTEPVIPSPSFIDGVIIGSAFSQPVQPLYPMRPIHQIVRDPVVIVTPAPAPVPVVTTPVSDVPDEHVSTAHATTNRR